MTVAYTFKSIATADLLMLTDSGNALLRLIGKAPSERGIITVEQIPEAIRAIENAVAASDENGDAGEEPGGDESRKGESSDQPDPKRVTLRQRAWPFLEMLRQAQSAGEPVTWGI